MLFHLVLKDVKFGSDPSSILNTQCFKRCLKCGFCTDVIKVFYIFNI